MRGDDRESDAMFSYIRPEQRVPADHPLRPIRAMVDAALRERSGEFARLYPKVGRPSIPPEKLLRYDDFGPSSNEIGREVREALRPAMSPAIFDD